MNAKRWIALGLVALLLVVSGITKLATTMLTSDQEKKGSLLSHLFSADDEISEVVVEDGNENAIALLSVDGTIQDTGESSLSLGSSGYNHSFFMEQLETIQNTPEIKGILLTINSPGGGVMESAQIHDKLVQIKKKRKIPIYVSMGSMAASGGYYIATAADKIFASKETMTGSLGVIMQGYDYSELMKKVGISENTIKSGKYKDMMSETRKMTTDERTVLQNMINDSYNEFVHVVMAGRHLSEAEVRKIADGRIYDGRQAKKVGLIDDFGYQEDTLHALKKENKLKGASVIRYESNSGIGSLFEASAKRISGLNHSDIITMMKQLGSAKAPRIMYLYGG
ncbi:signal peptide peptidase SppA [Listeria sp. PSOL-1]|uniref:signal peptide peptidase SppA n=1 Tax=Listeria sp. PSOL-1 TaxID=1844999 RepID=UPI0013D677FB|nr:signal peptide peptidase SppA [Listeria sp. PSOL-1]